MKQFHRNFHRRTILRAGGSSLLLPGLASLMPQLAMAQGSSEMVAPKTTPKRLCFVYFGLGVSLPPQEHIAHNEYHWFPHGLGADYRLTKSTAALEPYRDQISFLSGLSHPRTRTMYSHSTGGYFLSGADPETPVGNSISADQIYASHIGSETRYPYIMMASEGGIGDFRRPNTLSYTSGGQPIPSIGTPRAVYDEMFGVPKGSPEDIRRAFGREKSILDAVAPDLKTLQDKVSAEDRMRLEQYLTAVRALENRLDRAEAWLDVPRPKVPQENFTLDVDPIEDGPTDFMDAMYQLIHTAFVTDSTRMVTYMKVKESPGGLAARFPEALGLPHHHSLSHDFNKEGGYERWGQYDAYLSERFAGFLKMMSETDDPYAEGSLLDNTIVLYGSGTSDVHNPRNFPLVLAGGKNFGFKHGEHRRYEESVPMSNLLLTLLQQLDVPIDQFSDSTGAISDIIV